MAAPTLMPGSVTSHGLATDALKDVFWSAELTLPCGRYSPVTASD
ncbi:MAG TPA: hypothetical protein VGQ83_34060 [Polyangia bacterium]